MQFELEFNDTQYLAYEPVPPASPQSNTLTLCVSVSLYDPEANTLLSQSNVTIQPWQAYPSASTASSPDVAGFTSNATLTNVVPEVYDIFTQASTGYPWLLVQDSLDDEGKLFLAALSLGCKLSCFHSFTRSTLLILGIQA